jgi:hypothetical protein
MYTVVLSFSISRYFCQLELNLTRQEIQKAKDSIIGLSEFAPGGRDSLQWPIGKLYIKL